MAKLPTIIPIKLVGGFGNAEANGEVIRARPTQPRRSSSLRPPAACLPDSPMGVGLVEALVASTPPSIRRLAPGRPSPFVLDWGCAGQKSGRRPHLEPAPEFPVR